MKAILISEILEPEEQIKPVLEKYDFDLIHYRSPLKAMDNLTEISPDALIINAVDFPRHWKVISQHIRWDKPKESVVLILLTDKSFSQQDSDKASESGIQATLEIKESVLELLPEIQKVFDEYICDKSKIKKNTKEEKDFSKLVQCAFVNPNDEVIITGLVKNISEESLIFEPDFPQNTSSIQEGTMLNACGIQINAEQIITKCLVKTNSNILELAFVDLSASDKAVLASV